MARGNVYRVSFPNQSNYLNDIHQNMQINIDCIEVSVNTEKVITKRSYEKSETKEYGKEG